MAKIECPLWRREANQVTGGSGWIMLDSDRAGGRYRYTDEAMDALAAIKSDRQRAKITTWLVDQRQAGIPAPLLTAEAVDKALQQRAMSVSGSKERVFLFLMSIGVYPKTVIEIGGVVTPSLLWWQNQLAAWTEGASNDDTFALVNLLVEDGLLAGSSGTYKLTAKGFRYIEELESGGANTLQAFVAMWFADEMKESWRTGFAPAIRDAGYQPFRIDGLHHNGKIDDEIVAQIKRSRFLIADFTCGGVEAEGAFQPNPRGGVYYEAGLAHGLGMDVIFTCREDMLDYLHFDTRQFAHIVWATPADLRAQLYNRIAATLKEAPNAPGAGNGIVDPPTVA